MEIEQVNEVNGVGIDDVKMKSLVPINQQLDFGGNSLIPFEDIHMLSGTIDIKTVMSDENVSEIDELNVNIGGGPLKKILNMEFLLDHAVDEKFVDDGKKQVLINGEDTDTITLSDLLKDGSDIGDWKQITG